MNLSSFTLKAGTEIVGALIKYVAENDIQAASVLTCVGGMQHVKLRMPGATKTNQDIRDFDAPFEIVSLVGTITKDSCHLHVSLSDPEGTVIGGHLKEGVVRQVAEVVIADDQSVTYSREFDPSSGFRELVIKKRL